MGNSDAYYVCGMVHVQEHGVRCRSSNCGAGPLGRAAVCRCGAEYQRRCELARLRPGQRWLLPSTVAVQLSENYQGRSKGSESVPHLQGPGWEREWRQVVAVCGLHYETQGWLRGGLLCRLRWGGLPISRVQPALIHMMGLVEYKNLVESLYPWPLSLFDGRSLRVVLCCVFHA